ncbi:MAG TPA: nuclear transport factor 2 family protein, partial [Gaiellaceae bacterium]|nr:nuclear transport factor 2 family protein [Gaiellaceae bacterium]
MSARELIERYNGAWNAQDLDTIASLHAPEIVFHNHTADEKAVGDDFAVCEWTASARGVEWEGVDVFPVRDGLIARK